MKTNYVLIDFENVQPDSLQALNLDHVKIMVFVGANQAKISVAVATELQQMGGRAEYVKMAGSGRNSLDFHIAYYIGRLSAADPDGFFHIISKDTGFDPLIRHLKERKIFIRRSESVCDLPFLKAAQPMSVSERAEVCAQRLKGLGASRPRLVKTLRNSVHSYFMKALSEKELEAVLQALEREKKITISGTKVAYHL